jgi:aminomethyltransferase
MQTQEIKTTPLLNEHTVLGAKMAPFAGWHMPIQYEGIIAEHNHTRGAASLFDICHMGEFYLKGGAI